MFVLLGFNLNLTFSSRIEFDLYLAAFRTIFLLCHEVVVGLRVGEPSSLVFPVNLTSFSPVFECPAYWPLPSM